MNIDNEKMPDTLIGEVIKDQKARLADKQELSQRIKDGKMINKGPNVFSWLAVPFQINHSLQGAIALQSYDKANQFNEIDKEFLTFLGQHISTAIDQKLKDQKLQHQALHDSVTSLANRSLFLDRLEHAFIRSNRSSKSDLAVLFIDFDDFKAINDNFGHQAGDEILRVSAERMQAQLRSSDTLARIGGDEYAVLLEDLDNEPMVLAVSQRILDSMAYPIISGNDSIQASISIGISLKDEKVEHFEDLLKNADHAMYHAKRKGKNNIQLYEESLHQSILSDRVILQELKIAIKQKQLFFYFQPIMELKSNRVVGFEALVRWQHPTRGIISPDNFIQIAEQHDLMSEIDSQLLNSVAEQIIYWRSITVEKFYISINISSQRFVDSKLITDIKQVIKKYNLPNNCLVVELTEHILMKNIAKARNLFHQLKALGIKISLDDFGTGYSSLSYIHQLPFDVIKIDRSFISHISEENTEHPIISIIVSLAKTLDIQLVAEGIETQQQLTVLKNMGCDFGQGFLLSRPIPPEKTTAIVKSPSMTFIN
jgi:diguanylate cyclase (GGDEF)-like protein